MRHDADRVCSLVQENDATELHRRSIRYRRFRSRRLHHLHHSRHQGREECRGVRSNFVRMFEVKLPSAKSVFLERSG